MKYTGEYNSYSGRGRRKRRGGVALLDFIVFILTVAAALLLGCAYMARFVGPASKWFFSFAALGAPILYIINIVLCLYWVIRWKWYAAIPGAMVLVGAGYLTLFFRPSLSRHYEGETKGTVVVMTYNVMGFLDDAPDGTRYSTIDSIAAMVGRVGPDVLCIQEFQARSADQKEAIDEALGMKYNAVKYKMTNSRGGGWGVAVYSNYPIAATGRMEFPGSNNSSMWADLVTGPGDTVRVFNNHLQTTSVNSSNRDFIQNQEFLTASAEREERVRGIASKLRNNYAIRAAQADTLAPVIRSSPHKLIVCGDFNDTPLSYVYFKIRGPLVDSFAKKGHGIDSNTFRGLFNLFRIDYILHSPEIKTLHYDALSEDFSDHKAVVVRLKLPV